MENTPQYKDEDHSPEQQEPSSWEKMAQEVLVDEPGHEVAEKKFYETDVEFTDDGIAKFRDGIFNASPDEVKRIIDSRISILEENADKTEKISPLPHDQHIHRGYISKDTMVSFDDAFGSGYKLKDPEYLYAAVNYLRDNKEQITGGYKFFVKVLGFIESYFGVPINKNKDRWETIRQKTGYESIEDENDYFEALNNIDISVFKGEHIAMCSERSAMAQNIMSLFGYETYYVVGDVSVDGANEGHAYNIVANKYGQKTIVDYSVPSSVKYNGTSWHIPTKAEIEDYDSFVAGDQLETTTWRHVIQGDGKVAHEREHALKYRVLSKKVMKKRAEERLRKINQTN